MLKKLFKTILMLSFVSSLTLIGCANDSSDSGSVNLPAAPETIPSGYIRINYQGSADCLWIWQDFDSTEKAKLGSWPNGIKFAYKNGDFVCVDLKLASNPTMLGMIPLKGSTSLSGGDVKFYFPSMYNQIYLKANDLKVYVKPDMTTQATGVYAAAFTAEKVITLSGNATLSADTVTLTDKNGNVSIASYDSEAMTVTLTNSVKSTFSANMPYTLKVKVGDNTNTVTVSLDSTLVENWFGSSAVTAEKAASLKLGVTVNGTKASFKTWAPLARKVSLELFSDSANLTTPTETKDMTVGESGFWTIENVEFGSNKYYKYAIQNDDYTKHVSDIWAYAASADSVASQIADISQNGVPTSWEASYTNPWTGTSYNDAVIYEMHIRDWSRAVVTDSTGKFLDIANSDTIINHLKDLGITHVQILPMFDYSQKNDDDTYNWGYNPYHYNVPEGRYVTKNYTDGTQAVSEMREMIKKLHDAGISVIMDVVYNHTSGTGDESLYDMTVPKYFYRMKDGSYVNGSGCGNEIATNHAMARYYVVESLKHWMKDYHINGFRFDLMGCLEASTMKEIYDELYQIDPKVMVYGEPWTGGDSAVSDGAVAAGKGTTGAGYGAFDDEFRDAVKGGEFGGLKLGAVQGEYENSAKLLKGLVGDKTLKRNTTGNTGLALHYVECHDNYTLFDKLIYSTLPSAKRTGDAIAPNFAAAYSDVMGDSSKLTMVKDQVKLCGAFVLLSQGTPFINGGQEFLRTKKGSPDSYAADTKGGITWTNTAGTYNIDDVNTINLAMKDTYKDVYNTYKALIKIRKDIDAFTKGKYAEANAYNSNNGVVKYSVDNSTSSATYEVYFNTTDADVSVTGSGKKFTINETDGTYSIATESAAIGSIPARSFVILKK